MYVYISTYLCKTHYVERYVYNFSYKHLIVTDFFFIKSTLLIRTGRKYVRRINAHNIIIIHLTVAEIVVSPTLSMT